MLFRSSAKLTLQLDDYNPGCKLVAPQPGERCQSFDNFEPDQAIPGAVLSAQFFRLGLSLPLHPFLHEVIQYYDVAPLQLTPNSYRMAVCMYILYDQLFHPADRNALALAARELAAKFLSFKNIISQCIHIQFSIINIIFVFINILAYNPCKARDVYIFIKLLYFY